MISTDDRAKLTTTLVRVFKDAAMGMLVSGKTITIDIPERVYYNAQQVLINAEDILDWCFQKEIGGNHMSLLMM